MVSVDSRDGIHPAPVRPYADKPSPEHCLDMTTNPAKPAHERAPARERGPVTSVEEESAGGPLAGPWLQAFWVAVPMPLRSKSNFRRGQRPAEWASHQRFERDLGVLVRSQLPDGWEVGEPDAPLSERPVIVSTVFARSLLDAGNFSKSVLDACQGIVFRTDASAGHSGAFGIRSRSGQRAYLGFARLQPGASLEELVIAASALNSATLKNVRLD